jgi:hypothetical protein
LYRLRMSKDGWVERQRAAGWHIVAVERLAGMA